MDFSIPEDLRLLQAAVRRFTQEELMPIEREYLHQERVPDEVIIRLEERVKELGWWMLGVPAEYGGGGVSELGMHLVLEETSKAIFGLIQEKGFGREPEPLLYHCDEEQKERYLYPVIRGEKRATFAQTEPNAGSDPASLETTAVRQGDNYVLNGTKTFIHGSGKRTDFYEVLATVDRSKGRAGITCFIVEKDTPGFRVEREIPIMGGALTYELSFRDCVVPARNRIGEEGEGFALGQRYLGKGRLRFGPHSVGMAERALEMAIQYSKQRITFGQPLSQRQSIQWMLADSAVEIDCTRWMSYHGAWMYDQGMDIRDKASRVKLYASEMVGRVVDRALQVHGALGATDDLPLAKMYRQVRHARIGEGAAEIMRFVIARNLLRG